MGTESFLGEIFGGAAGGGIVTLLSRVFGKGAERAGEEVGKKVAERAFTEKHPELFQRASHMLDEPYAKICIARIQEAVLVDREDWMAGILGDYLQDFPEDRRKKVLMSILALSHIDATRMTLRELRAEWYHPQKSAFLAHLHSMDRNPVERAMRRTAQKTDEALDAVEANLHAICARRGWRVNR